MPFIRKKKLHELQNAGNRMSNWLYNMSQLGRQIEPDMRPGMRELSDTWDKTKFTLFDTTQNGPTS